MFTDDIKNAFLNYLKSVENLNKENVELRYTLNIIKEQLKKYEINNNNAVFANPIEDCCSIYNLVNNTLENIDIGAEE